MADSSATTAPLHGISSAEAVSVIESQAVVITSQARMIKSTSEENQRLKSEVVDLRKGQLQENDYDSPINTTNPTSRQREIPESPSPATVTHQTLEATLVDAVPFKLPESFKRILDDHNDDQVATEASEPTAKRAKTNGESAQLPTSPLSKDLDVVEPYSETTLQALRDEIDSFKRSSEASMQTLRTHFDTFTDSTKTILHPLRQEFDALKQSSEALPQTIQTHSAQQTYHNEAFHTRISSLEQHTRQKPSSQVWATSSHAQRLQAPVSAGVQYAQSIPSHRNQQAGIPAQNLGTTNLHASPAQTFPTSQTLHGQAPQTLSSTHGHGPNFPSWIDTELEFELIPTGTSYEAGRSAEM
ncbi:MAG: hypothetical protein L6R41_004332 [Letrouitia leprolyta]|nr:MAG: hypothetical protein L6R41_004332 [Letrouitia leprolyta]